MAPRPGLSPPGVHGLGKGSRGIVRGSAAFKELGLFCRFYSASSCRLILHLRVFRSVQAVTPGLLLDEIESGGD